MGLPVTGRLTALKEKRAAARLTDTSPFPVIIDMPTLTRKEGRGRLRRGRRGGVGKLGPGSFGRRRTSCVKTG